MGLNIFSQYIIQFIYFLINYNLNCASNFFSFIISNRTDWVLKEVGFRANFKPPSRIALQKIEPEKILAFEGVINLKIKFKSLDKTGKSKLHVKMTYRNPLDIKTFENISIKDIEIRIL